MPETIVITGGNGFVGKHLVDWLSQEKKDRRLVVWDRQVAPSEPSVTSRVVDITDPATYRRYLQALQPAWVVHLAALAPVGESWRDPAQVHRINVEGTRQLLEAIVQDSPHTTVLAISTADIYGQAASTPLSELPLGQAHPHSPYAQSKWEMEQIIEAQYNERVIRVRPFPHIGPGQQRGFVTADFASQIAAIEAEQQPPVINVGNIEAVRDFTDVRDVVRAYALLLEKGKLGDVYHVACGRGLRIADILEKLLALSSVKITVETDPERLRPAEIPVLIGDASKLQRVTGWKPEISIDQSLQDILDYWRQQVVSN